MDVTLPSELAGAPSGSAYVLPETAPSSAALDYVGAPMFHQVMKCPRTNQRISFSDGGVRDGPPVLFCLPSMSTRYVGGPMYHERAKKGGARIIAIDRPGNGGTPQCDIDDRLEIAAKHVLSVLEYLGIRQVALIGHSAGSIYALHLLNKYPQILHPNPRIYFTSPWVPTSVSKQFGLQLLPSVLVSHQHDILRPLIPALNFIGKAVSSSSNLFKQSSIKAEKEENKKFVIPNKFRPEDGSQYRPQPPYHAVLGPAPASSKLIDECVLSEPLQGCSQDYLLSLGSGGGVDEEWYRRMVKESLDRYAEHGNKVAIEIWWAADDWMIPKKGRKWFDNLFSVRPDVVDFRSFELPDMGHDGPVGYVEVVCGIFEDAAAHDTR